MSRSSSTQNLTGLAAVNGLARLLDDDIPPEPAVNLSNRLNPNNIHYDRELAARCAAHACLPVPARRCLPGPVE